MAGQNGSAGSTRRLLSLIFMALGAILLLLVPTMLVVLAFAQTRDVDLSGTVVILSAVGGMALVVIGAALRD